MLKRSPCSTSYSVLMLRREEWTLISFIVLPVLDCKEVNFWSFGIAFFTSFFLPITLKFYSLTQTMFCSFYKKNVLGIFKYLMISRLSLFWKKRKKKQIHILRASNAISLWGFKLMYRLLIWRTFEVWIIMHQSSLKTQAINIHKYKIP